MRTLTVILHERDLDRVAPLGEVLTLDADAWTRLRASGVHPITPADLDGYAERVRTCTDEALRLWRANANAGFRGVNLFELVAYRHARWIARCAAVAVAVDSAIEHVDPRAVRLHDPPGGHALDRPHAETGMPALYGVATAVAERRGCAVEFAAHARSDNAVTAPLPASPVRTDLEEGHALCIADGPELPRMRAIAETLYERTGLAAVTVTHGAPEDGAVTVDAYAGPRADVDVAPVSAKPTLADHDGSLPALLLTASAMRTHLDFLTTTYASSVSSNYERWRRALTERRPAVVVGAYPSIGLEAAARLGIPALLLPHGVMMTGMRTYYRLLPHRVHIGAVGEVHRRMLIGDGVDPQRIRVTGVVEHAATPRRVPPPPPSPALLIPTCETTRPAHLGEPPETSFAAEASVIERLAKTMTAHGWTVRVRRHPRYDRSRAFYERIADAVGSSRFEITDADLLPLGDDVHRSTCVAFTGAPTSAIVEAATHGRPVLIVTEAHAPGVLERWGLGGFAHARTVADAADGLMRTARDGTHMLEHTTAAMRTFLAEDAIDRCVDAIAELVREPVRPAG